MSFLFKNRASAKSTFYCFIPMVSLLTFFIEFCFAFYIWYRYKATTFSNLCIAILVCLGIFQLAEFLICTAYQPYWIKIGYIAITLLPALGMHLISSMTKRHAFLTTSGYVIAGMLIVVLFFAPQLEFYAVCQPHFVEVFNSPWYGISHALYYAFFLVAAMYTLWYSMRKHIGDSSEEKWMLIAYTAFVVPAIVLFYLKVVSHYAVPSIMCGFAVLLAIILAFVVVPRYYKVAAKRAKKKRIHRR